MALGGRVTVCRAMAAPKKYSDEMRECATRMALEARRDPSAATGAIKRIAQQLGIQAGPLPHVGSPSGDRRRRPAGYDGCSAAG